jgi:hypothetical protein
MLTKELHGSSFERSPPSLPLLDISLTCNESIDDVKLAIDGDEVHSPIVAKKRGKLPHKRMMFAVEKSIVKKSQGKSNEPCNTNPNQKKKKKGYLLSYLLCLIIIIKNLCVF